eukprot:Awhi_evm1s15701
MHTENELKDVYSEVAGMMNEFSESNETETIVYDPIIPPAERKLSCDSIPSVIDSLNIIRLIRENSDYETSSDDEDETSEVDKDFLGVPNSRQSLTRSQSGGVIKTHKSVNAKENATSQFATLRANKSLVPNSDVFNPGITIDSKTFLKQYANKDSNKSTDIIRSLSTTATAVHSGGTSPPQSESDYHNSKQLKNVFTAPMPSRSTSAPTSPKRKSKAIPFSKLKRESTRSPPLKTKKEAKREAKEAKRDAKKEAKKEPRPSEDLILCWTNPSTNHILDLGSTKMNSNENNSDDTKISFHLNSESSEDPQEFGQLSESASEITDETEGLAEGIRNGVGSFLFSSLPSQGKPLNKSNSKRSATLKSTNSTTSSADEESINSISTDNPIGGENHQASVDTLENPNTQEDTHALDNPKVQQASTNRPQIYSSSCHQLKAAPVTPSGLTKKLSKTKSKPSHASISEFSNKDKHGTYKTGKRKIYLIGKKSDSADELDSVGVNNNTNDHGDECKSHNDIMNNCNSDDEIRLKKESRMSIASQGSLSSVSSHMHSQSPSLQNNPHISSDLEYRPERSASVAQLEELSNLNNLYLQRQRNHKKSSVGSRFLFQKKKASTKNDKDNTFEEETE